MKTFSIVTRALLGLAAFTVLTGARGCTLEAGSYEYGGYVDAPYSGGGTTYVGSPTASGWYGDLALTVYAPPASYVTPDTWSVRVNVRQGSAFGPLVASQEAGVNSAGVGAIDLLGLGYGYYDVEVIGLDYYGDVVSHAATGVTIDAALIYLTLDLEAATFSGDVVMEISEPDGGLYAGPIDTIDYTIWEFDSITGEYILVEQVVELHYNPWEPPAIPNLTLGDYYIEVFAFDAWGYEIYDYNAEFSHSSDLTVLPVVFQYTY